MPLVRRGTILAAFFGRGFFASKEWIKPAA